LHLVGYVGVVAIDDQPLLDRNMTDVGVAAP
jgi:hypothetical protein